MSNEVTPRIGIIGSGFVAHGLCALLKKHPRYQLSKVLTRRTVADVNNQMGIDPDMITHEAGPLIDNADLVIECSGDPIHGTAVLEQVLQAELPVVTMDAELQVTTGSWLARRGYITEAEGDQPGSLAALQEEAIEMGFNPIVLSNVKGFLNTTPTIEDMRYWSRRNGISVMQVTSFTDGTKVQFEQALVANGLNATIAQKGLLGYESDNLNDGAMMLARAAEELAIDGANAKLSDYILSSKSPPGVFVVATHDEEQAEYLRYYKLGDGPYYVLVRPYHLCHLEVLKTVRRVVEGGTPLLTNGHTPTVSVAAIAKRSLEAGQTIERGIGGFDVRGEAINIIEHPKHVPLGLFTDIRMRRTVEPEQVITFDDIEFTTAKMADSRALAAWGEIKRDITATKTNTGAERFEPA